jgi:hypothetical protein
MRPLVTRIVQEINEDSPIEPWVTTLHSALLPLTGGCWDRHTYGPGGSGNRTAEHRTQGRAPRASMLLRLDP